MKQNDIEEFLRLLKEVKTENIFNPYTDICPFHDIGIISPKIRSDNFRQYFTILDKTDTLLIGEAAGYLGCRRTGLAFMDEITFNAAYKVFGVLLQRATKSGKNKEISATTVWNMVSKCVTPPFLWNIVPFHPHNNGKPLTNRTPNPKDHKAVKECVDYFLSNANFDRIFAIGKVSQKILKTYGYTVDYIRHPSHGGITMFQHGIMNRFEMKKEKNRLKLFLGENGV